MTVRDKANLLVNWGISIKQLSIQANYDPSGIGRWLCGKAGVSPEVEARIDLATQYFTIQLENVLDTLKGAESANSNQSTLSTLQTAKNGEAT